MRVVRVQRLEPGGPAASMCPGYSPSTVPAAAGLRVLKSALSHAAAAANATERRRPQLHHRDRCRSRPTALPRPAPLRRDRRGFGPFGGVAGRRVGRAPTAAQPPGNLKFPGATPGGSRSQAAPGSRWSHLPARWAASVRRRRRRRRHRHRAMYITKTPNGAAVLVGGSQHPGRGQSSVSLLRLSYPPAGEPRV